MSTWKEQLPDLSKVKDRGSKKWSMSMMLPEHTALIREMIEEDKKVPKPQLDDFDYDMLNEELGRAYQSQSIVELKTWRAGAIFSHIGVVEEVDTVARRIYLRHDGLRKSVFMKELVAIGMIYEA